MVGSKILVYEAFEGVNEKLPLYIMFNNHNIEAKYGDIVSIRCRISSFENFLTSGGPFRRGRMNFNNWIEKIDLSSYMWPSLSNIAYEIEDKIKRVAETLNIEKFTQVTLIGPTELSEYSCAPGVNSLVKDMLYHRFDFAVLTVLNLKLASRIHEEFHRIVLESAKVAAESEYVDSVRIADDFCSYKGAIYRPEFINIVLERQREIANAVRSRGKYVVLHSDGDIGYFIDKLSFFNGIHPLDIVPKTCLSNALTWIDKIKDLRRRSRLVFLTGIPVELLYNSRIPVVDLKTIIDYTIKTLGFRRLILTTTHRPYPNINLNTAEERIKAIVKYSERYR
ncbi:MAG: hypothetical protein QXY40_06055 [Candidatus Methanomethylicia archaeon]